MQRQDVWFMLRPPFEDGVEVKRHGKWTFDTRTYIENIVCPITERARVAGMLRNRGYRKIFVSVGQGDRYQHLVQEIDMGRRGPPPMTDAQRKTRGRRHRKKEPPVPTLPVGAPEMPDNIRQDKRAAAAWKRFSKDLMEIGVLHPSQWAALAVLCESYATAMEMAERLQKDGILVKTSRGKLYTHPAVRIQKQAWAMFLRCAQEFGLTPMAGLRVRANVAPAKPKDEDDDGEFLFGSKGRVVGTIGKKDT